MGFAKYFSEIRKRDGQSLSERLEKALERYISELPENTLLLPERDFAIKIGVNRHTLGKAMDPLVKKGWLERSKRGTIVRHSPESEMKSVLGGERSSLSWVNEVHPFIFTEMSRLPLKIVLYENIPSQKDFWTSATALFTRMTGRKVEILWLPRECDTQSGLSEYAAGVKCDIIQLGSHLFPFYPEIDEMLIPLPEDILTLFKSPDYRFREFFEDIDQRPPVAGKVLPIHCQFWMDYFRRSLAKKFGLDLSGFGKGYPIAKLWKEVSTKLPDGTYFSTSFVTLELASPIRRPIQVTLQSAKTFYKAYYELLAKGAPAGRRLFLYDSRTPYQMVNPELLRAFNEDRLLRITGHSTTLEAMRASIMYRDSAEPLSCMVLFTRKVSMAYAGLGIMKQSTKKDAAMEFFRFLLSEKIQRDAASTMFSAPFFKKADSILAERLGLETSDVTKNLNWMRNLDPETDFLIGWSGNRTEVDAILDGRMGVDEAVENTLENLRNCHAELFRQSIPQSIKEVTLA